ncbi:hypothetical protein HIM_12667 [Hirsutella minnesotensis 3608]|uniref:Fucose-specific lectin n=1 Tax=Hirsutella minnesotensis 3608 TaxID=1043627 RepID=A0A0F7ZQI9_9HYPO|nr:hypothetical protein HIM_12667 [Hirsutella minnesotensis 3608]
MPALTAIVNKAVAGDRSISLFYNTSNAQLGLLSQSGTQDDDANEELTWAAGNDDYPGVIMNPSQMSSSLYQGLNFVFAVTTPKSDSATSQSTNQVSIVSPVYKKLAITLPGNISVTSCSADDGGWVYFTNRYTTDTTTVQEVDLRTGRTTNFLSTSSSWINTSLAAYYDPTKKDRFVVFEASSLMELSANKQQIQFIGATGNMLRNTPLAVSYHDGKAYLYYCQMGDRALYRIVKNGETWGIASQVADAPTIDEASQLAVVTANGFNHLFYVAQSGAQSEPTATGYFTHVRDSLN